MVGSKFEGFSHLSAKLTEVDEIILYLEHNLKSKTNFDLCLQYRFKWSVYSIPVLITIPNKERIHIKDCSTKALINKLSNNKSSCQKMKQMRNTQNKGICQVSDTIPN